MADQNNQQYVLPGGEAAPYNPKPAPFHARTFFGQGALMSGGDELESWVRSKLSGRPQEQIRQEIQNDIKSYAAKYPEAAAWQEFTGAAVPNAAAAFFPPMAAESIPFFLSPLAKLQRSLAYTPESNLIKRGAATGAGYGGVSGYNAGEGNYWTTDRLPGAAWGAASGATFGTALPVVGQAIGKVGSHLWDTLAGTNPVREAEQKLVEQMRKEGVTGKDLQGMSQEDYNNLGIPSMIAHYLPKTTKGVIPTAGAPAVAALERKLVGVQRGETKRVEERLKEKLRPADYYAEEQNLTDQLRKNAKGMYDAAYEHGEVNDPAIMSVLNTPTFKKAFEEAKAISSTEAEAAKLAGEDPSQYMLRELYVPREVKPGVFEMELRDIPDVRTLDYVKRGVDALIEKGYKGEGMSSAQANALKNLRNQFVAKIDENVPAYKEARNMYKGDLEVRDALNMGKTDFNKLDHEQIAKFMGGASEAEKEAFRTGAMRYLQNNIFDKPNAAGKIINSEKMTQKLRAMFPTEEDYQLVRAAIEKEAMLYSRASDALAGSNTIPKMEAVKEVTGKPESTVDKMMGGHGLISSVLHAFRGDDRLSPEVVGSMAEMLSKGSPNEVAAVVKALDKRERVMNAQGKVIQGATQGTIAGTEGANATPGVTPEASPGDIMLNEMMDYYRNWKESGKGGGSEH